MHTTKLPLKFARHTRQDRLEQAAAVIERGGGISLSHVAFRMAMKKTPYLRSIINELIDMGIVYERDYDAGYPIPTKLYYPVFTASE